jgi:RimJ/RimL family protein N-acetyltransferase
MFNLFDQIETERFALRPLTQDDRLTLFSIASDPSIWSHHPEPNRYQRPVFDRYFDKILSLEAPIIILDKHEGTPVGSSSYYFYNFEKSIITIGYSFLAVKYWVHRPSAPHSINSSMCHSLFCKQHMEVLWIWLP